MWFDDKRGKPALLKLDAGFIVAAEFIEGRPLLTFESDKLALVFANRAVIRRAFRLLKLSSAGDTNGMHLSRLARRVSGD